MVIAASTYTGSGCFASHSRWSCSSSDLSRSKAQAMLQKAFPAVNVFYPDPNGFLCAVNENLIKAHTQRATGLFAYGWVTSISTGLASQTVVWKNFSTGGSVIDASKVSFVIGGALKTPVSRTIKVTGITDFGSQAPNMKEVLYTTSITSLPDGATAQELKCYLPDLSKPNEHHASFQLYDDGWAH
jgi:hypothetical protein